jgi:hypothetical protein
MAVNNLKKFLPDLTTLADKLVEAREVHLDHVKAAKLTPPKSPPPLPLFSFDARNTFDHIKKVDVYTHTNLLQEKMMNVTYAKRKKMYDFHVENVFFILYVVRPDLIRVDRSIQIDLLNTPLV